MKTAKKKTAKAVKKGSRPAGGPAAGGAPFRLKARKHYESRCGRYVARIDKVRGDRAFGEWVIHPTTFVPPDEWQSDGTWWPTRVTSNYDLVREVPRPPRARK